MIMEKQPNVIKYIPWFTYYNEEYKKEHSKRKHFKLVVILILCVMTIYSVG